MERIFGYTIFGDAVYGDFPDPCYVFNSRSGWHPCPANARNAALQLFVVNEVWTTPEKARAAYCERVLAKVNDMLRVKRSCPDATVIESLLLAARRHLTWPGIPGWPTDASVRPVFDPPVLLTIDAGIKPYKPVRPPEPPAVMVCESSRPVSERTLFSASDMERIAALLTPKKETD